MAGVMERLLAAMNAHDLDAMVHLFAEDYASEQPAHPARSFVGREQVRANWAAMLTGIPDFAAQLTRWTADGDTEWGEWRWVGTRADGQPFEARGVTLFTIRDDQIAAARLYMEQVEQGGADVAETVGRLSGRAPDRTPRA